MLVTRFATNGAPGIATRNKDATNGAPGIATRNPPGGFHSDTCWMDGIGCNPSRIIDSLIYFRSS